MAGKKKTQNVIDAALAKAAKKGGKGKASAKAVVAPKVAVTDEGEEATTGAARPRKFDYGIYPASVLRIDPDKEVEYNDDKEPIMHKALKEPYEQIAAECKGKKPKGIDVNEFQAEGGTRSQIRKLARQGYITITAEDGEVYPQDYVAKPKKAKAEEED